MFQGFTPVAKIQGNKAYSIISDHIGKPIQAIDDNGELVWSCDYDIYGRLKNVKGERTFIPFRQVGQIEDAELEGLYYNRYRWYNSNTGCYISQDPIGLWGGDNAYSYVHNSNLFIDVLGLAGAKIATLTLSNGNTYTAESGEKTLTTNENFDKIVKNAVEKANDIKEAPYYGKCAEINAINEALSNGETLKTLKGGTMDTRFNKNRKGTDVVKVAKKGDAAEACECCKIVLEELSITDKNKGCGNK